MIDYELARQLKEAGFPQEPFWQVDINAWGGSWYYFFVPEGCPQMAFLDLDGYKIATGEHGYGHPIVKIHTLSELIEACGEDFATLIRCDCEHCKWNCHGRTLQGPHLEPYDDDGWNRSFNGSTPEEAVAMLYIAIKNVALQKQ